MFWGSGPKLAFCLHVLHHALSSVIWGSNESGEIHPLKYLFTPNTSVAVFSTVHIKTEHIK